MLIDYLASERLLLQSCCMRWHQLALDISHPEAHDFDEVSVELDSLDKCPKLPTQWVQFETHLATYYVYMDLVWNPDQMGDQKQNAGCLFDFLLCTNCQVKYGTLLQPGPWKLGIMGGSQLPLGIFRSMFLRLNKIHLLTWHKRPSLNQGLTCDINILMWESDWYRPFRCSCPLHCRRPKEMSSVFLLFVHDRCICVLSERGLMNVCPVLIVYTSLHIQFQRAALQSNGTQT